VDASLVGIDQLEARLGYPLVGAERTMAEQVLADASAVVRACGLPWPDPETAPAVVRTVVLNVAERKMRNPEGFRSEIEGSYQYHLPASAVTGLTLTPPEEKLIAAAAGMRGIASMPIAGFGGTV